jgi:hypothetical protein
MEILRFDSRVVDGRFARLVEQMREKLEASTVIRARRSIPEELSEELSFGQSLLALGSATRRNASQLDGQLDASNPLEPSDTARVI